MKLPTKLDRLYRFFQHEDPDVSHGCMWNVSAGALERKARVYRVMYEDSENQIKSEQTIHVSYPSQLKEFYEMLCGIMGRDDVDVEFQRACKNMVEQDPWLSLFLTNSLPLPGIDDVSASSGSTEHDAS